MQVAPNQISPGEPFDIFYFVRNPLDSTTYFVRAKVYDVRTGELLSTIALDQSPTNSRLFIKTVQAPPDPSGYGRNIVAIASVYLDSGFTQQSDSYEEQEQYYLIKAMAPTLPLGPAYTGETWSGVKCFTDAGTLQVSFNDGTNRMNWLQASTTVGTVTLSDNNTFAAGAKRYVDVGTAASSPTKISCTVKKAITAD
jgi:hypothetical protein